MRGLLYGVSPWDARAFLAAIAVLAVAATIAGFVPARRAANVNPAESLRTE
jgi:ABC-type antimicrobial peptide transport system permease subunit